ncbi:hypothetical protein JQ596_13455 [Bradyrhizobium manausense]|uniref:hypothetical protein n=1 Tax=Bradyrhizobium TaxID=374 RepID=UPI001BA52437|nr:MULTISPECIES: hypothetical protein [Bradyrhizobium]MBR0826549.1 hypothetical protein [Bradyrhizobium manausense]UVO28943.1 hypothetical protein KUF59_42090 [Bradyrhizobium arachidis]
MTRALTRRALELLVACLVAFPDVALAQTRSPSTVAPMASAATASPAWDPSLPGKWTYRSYVNRADVIVWDDPTDPAVRNLAALFGQGSTAPNAAKALSLVFGEGVMTFDPPSGNNVTGTLDMGGGLVLDLKGTMQTQASGDISVDLVGNGRDNTPTANWEYDYRATTAPKWQNGVNQIPTLVGTVIRAKPHDGGAAGVTASFISIKR